MNQRPPTGSTTAHPIKELEQSSALMFLQLEPQMLTEATAAGLRSADVSPAGLKTSRNGAPFLRLVTHYFEGAQVLSSNKTGIKEQQ